jgi:hypothetical protein
MPDLEGEQRTDSMMSDFCIGRITVRASFRGFAPTNLIPAESGVWVAFFDRVPIGRQLLRFDAPAGCEASHITANDWVFASGLGGIEGAEEHAAVRTWTVAFTVHADGTLGR